MQHEEQKRFWLAWSLTPRLGSDPAPARKRFLPIIKNAIAPGQHGKVARGLLSDLLAAFRAQELKAVMEREWEEADRIGCHLVVASTDMIVTMSEPVVRPFKQFLPLELFKPPIPLPRGPWFVLWHERTHRDPAHRWFRQQLRMLGDEIQAET